jgi:fructose-1,6-bisphosphatase/sedoheptulose 1,7-bisphosphatase-like protein
MSTSEKETKEKIAEAMKQIDWTDVAFALSQMALKVVSGKEIERTKYTVELAVPKEVATIIDMVAKKAELDPEQIYSTMASQGFDHSMQAQLQSMKQEKQEVQQPKVTQPVENPLEQLQSMGLDMSKFQNIFGRLGDLASNLEDLQKNVESKVNDVSNPKDTP